MPRIRKIAWFLALTFALDWGLVATYLALGGAWRMPGSMIVAVAYMFGPAVAAVIVQRWISREPLRRPLRIRFRPNRWFLVAWLAPPVLALAALGVGLLLPGVRWSPGMEGLFDRFASVLTPEQLAEMRRQADTLPVHPFWLTLGQGLVAGATVNAVAGLGEELGWRGFLQRELETIGFWKSSLLIGAIWGVWHAPIILLGHNFPEHPVPGVAVMTAFTVLFAPLLGHVTLRADSVIAAAIMHGTINATGGLAIMMLRGGSDLTVGMTGAAGLLVLVAANVGLFVWRRGKA